MAAFKPAGEQARWKYVYEELREKPYGHTIDYAEMGKLLELDPVEDRHAIQMAMRRAAKELSEKDFKHIESVRNVGYRIVDLPGQLELSRTRKKKADKAMVRAQDPVEYVNKDLLAEANDEVRRGFYVLARAMDVLNQAHRHLDLRQQRMEAALESYTSKTDKNTDEVEELKRRLAALEAKG